MFSLRHVGENGTTLDLMVDHVEPLSLSALLDHFGSGMRRITTACQAWPAGREHEPDSRITSLSMELDEAVPFLALVRDGALPAHYVGSTTLLLDRNVVDMLKKGKHAGTFAWLDDERNIVNPIMDALEGEARTTPTWEEFLGKVRSVAALVAQKLPKVRIVPFDDQTLRQLYAWRESFDARSEHETQFLLPAADLLACPVKAEQLPETERQLLTLCDTSNLRRGSVVVLAALALLYEGNDSRPLRGFFRLS